MAQTKVTLTEPTTYYSGDQVITLPAGEHFLAEGWTTTPPSTPVAPTIPAAPAAPVADANLNEWGQPYSNAMPGIDTALSSMQAGGTQTPEQMLAAIQAQGYNSSNLTGEITAMKTAEANRLAAREANINELFNIGANKIGELGERQEGGITARGHQFAGSGQTGLGMDSAITQNITMLRKDIAKELTDLEARRQESLLNADEASAARIDKQISDYQTKKDEATKWEFDKRMQILNAQIGIVESKQKAEMDILNTLVSIPKGTTVNIGGKVYQGMEETDPFFKSSDLVDLAMKLPIGQTQIITDPATGTEYNITGLAQPDANTQIFESEDANGNITYVTLNKATGEIINSINAGKIGKGFKANTSTTTPQNTSKEFYTALKEGVAGLQKGESWGTVFKRIKQRFPNVTDKEIDDGLGVDWREPGAFENWKQKQYKETQPRQFELEAEIWKQLGENPTLDNATKKQWIMQQGFDPNDFGIY